jgi:hypothetical protein
LELAAAEAAAKVGAGDAITEATLETADAIRQQLLAR